MKPDHLIPLTGLLPAWFRTPLLPVAMGKEWHAIGPFWLTSLILATVVGIAPDDEGMSLGLLALVLTNAALGASVMGHEFTHRTLAMLLTQPVTRVRLWQRKVDVAAVALLTGTAPVWLRLVVADDGPRSEPWVVVAVAGGTVLSGLCVAPWLTLLTRSTLAGTVFTAALPMLFLLAGQTVSLLVGSLGDWVGPWEDRIGIGFLVFLLVGQWPVSAYLAYRKFITLEAFEGRGQELCLPGWRRRWPVGIDRAAMAGGWQRRVIRKELRLQQVSLLVAGLFVIMWGMVALAKLLRPGLGLDLLGLGTPVYTLFMALLVGALACAEERHFGTLEGQLTLPVSVARQWAWKLGVVLAVALALGVLLPAGLRVLTPFDDLRLGAFEMNWAAWFLVMVPMTVLLASIALYASSVCQTTVRALLVSILIAMVLTMLLGAIHGNGVVGVLVSAFGSVKWSEPLPERPLIASLVVILGLALALHGLANYRTVEQRFRRVVAHLALLGAYAFVALGAYIAWGFALGHWGEEQPPESSATAMPLPPLAPAGAALFETGDFDDLPALARKLKQGNGPVSQHLASRLSSETQQGLANYDGSGPVSELLAAGLIEDLNRIVRGDSIFEAQRFDGVRLRPLLRDVAAQGPQAELGAFVNRMLIEDAYQNEILRGPLQLMMREGAAPGSAADAAPSPASPVVDVRLYPAIRGVFRQAAAPSTSPRTNVGTTQAPLMDIHMLRRYGLLPKGVKVIGEDGQAQPQASPAGRGTNPPVMDLRMLMRYGLVPKGMKITGEEGRAQPQASPQGRATNAPGN